MPFLKGLLRGDPAKAAAQHERRAKEYQSKKKRVRAAEEWAAAGRQHVVAHNLKHAQDCFLQAAQLYSTEGDANRGIEMLRAATDAALQEEQFEAAAADMDRVANIGARLKDDQLLLQALALKTVALIASNAFTKAKEAFREAQKLLRRLDPAKARAPLVLIADALAVRFIDGESLPSAGKLPNKTGESTEVDKLVARLVSLYNATTNMKFSLATGKRQAHIKERIRGRVTITSSVRLRVRQALLTLPTGFALVEPFNFQPDTGTKLTGSFTIDANLPGKFVVGPAVATLESGKQRFQLKSSSVSLSIEAAKSRIQLQLELPPNVGVGEEFELILRVQNDSHGEATDVNLRLKLPPSIALRTGPLEKRVMTLPPQQRVQYPLTLIASSTGALKGTVECQYTDASGKRQETASQFVVTAQAGSDTPKE
jgi:tetratricopeptide (TPR) repeat protein